MSRRRLVAVRSVAALDSALARHGTVLTLEDCDVQRTRDFAPTHAFIMDPTVADLRSLGALPAVKIAIFSDAPYPVGGRGLEAFCARATALRRSFTSPEGADFLVAPFWLGAARRAGVDYLLPPLVADASFPSMSRASRAVREIGARAEGNSLAKVFLEHGLYPAGAQMGVADALALVIYRIERPASRFFSILAEAMRDACLVISTVRFPTELNIESDDDYCYARNEAELKSLVQHLGRAPLDFDPIRVRAAQKFRECLSAESAVGNLLELLELFHGH